MSYTYKFDSNIIFLFSMHSIEDITEAATPNKSSDLVFFLNSYPDKHYLYEQIIGTYNS